MNHRSYGAAAALLALLAAAPASADFRADYDAALASYQAAGSSADIAAAAARIEKLAARDDAGILRANVFYWLGECYWDLGQYQRALGNFERALLYPLNYKEEAARFKAALCQVKLGRKDAAVWELTGFLRDYPASNLAGR